MTRLFHPFLALIASSTEPSDLPEECFLDVELGAKDVLKQFLPKGKQAGIEGYRALRDELGRRPVGN